MHNAHSNLNSQLKHQQRTVYSVSECV